jgi:hypothetical protein
MDNFVYDYFLLLYILFMIVISDEFLVRMSYLLFLLDLGMEINCVIFIVIAYWMGYISSLWFFYNVFLVYYNYIGILYNI